MATINIDQLVSRTVDTARRNIPYANTVEEAVRAALQEAHSGLSQEVFFTAVDHFGSEAAMHTAILQRLLTTHDTP